MKTSSPNLSQQPLKTQSGTEQRRSERKLGNFGATILLETGQRIRCLVKDFSKTGALLIVPSVLGIPDRFVLLVGSGFSRNVLVRRVGPSRLGVRFD